MFPQDVGIPSEAKDSIVDLGEVHLAFVPVSVLFGTDKGQFPSCAKASTDRNVLVLGPLRVEGGAVVVKGLPVARISVPVEPRADGAVLIDVEVIAHAIDDSLVLRASLDVLGN